MKQPLSAPRIIERPRIRNRLLDALETAHILLTAPAGYGKSIALRDLARHRPDTHLIPLTPADLDLSVLEARLAPLLKSENTILLDDAHLLAGGSEVCLWLEQQLSRRHPCWVLAGRRLPFEPHLLIVSGQTVHFTREMLAFTLAETTVLLSEHSDQIAAWRARLHGWPLALSLLSRLPPAADPLPTTEAHLFSYLTQAVFAQLPPALKQFMQVTAVPLMFNQALATELWPGSENAAALLAEIQQGDLYIQPAARPGWFRYHDLIREYLQREFTEQRAIAETAVAWFQSQDDIDTAVEQALDSGLNALAGQLISQLSLGHFHGDSSYLTYRRWVRQLDEAALAANPMLLLRLANATQLMTGYEGEARDYAFKAISLATAQGAVKTALLAQANLAHWHYQQGQLETARRQIEVALVDPACQEYPRLYGLRIASLILSDMGRYHEARPYFEDAIALAHEMNTRNEPFMNQANMAAKFWLPLGQIERARRQLEAVLQHFADLSGWTSQYLTYWCELETAAGNWPALAQTVAKTAATLDRVETATLHNQLWLAHYETILAVIEGSEDAVQAALARYAGLTGNSPLNQVCVAWLACWHLRRQGEWAAARERGLKALAQPTQYAVYRARLALEVDIAQAMQLIAGDGADFSLQEETKQFIRWRSGAELVRLRALLALVCHHQKDWRWQRHWTAVTAALQKPAYAQLLSRRDPELGVYFWRIAVAEGILEEQATAVLVAIGHYEPLLSLLHHEGATVRARAAVILAQIGDERAMPALTAVLASEPDKLTKQTMETAVVHLENQEPPRLTIQLMGDFALWRGTTAIADKRWHRPIVLRLFQYFALNAGRPLAKDRILEDLWPETEPAKAWVTFRTVYSRLRKVMEPFMPAKAPNRYVAVSGETYTFDPENNADIDIARFEQIVGDALRLRQGNDAFPISDALLNALQNYAPLLPNLPYAEWLLEARQRAQELYTEGCLYLAQAYLIRGDHAEAVAWARQTATAAPWLEEAYQTMMRAYARQGQRSLALRVYEEAAANLKQELNVTPSVTTEWLADRLRSGASI